MAEETGELGVDLVLRRMNRLRARLEDHAQPIDALLIRYALSEIVESVVELAVHLPYRTATAITPDFLRLRPQDETEDKP